jgi:hypothetical protein
MDLQILTHALLSAQMHFMSAPGNGWRHVIINTHCSWLHGSPRGFRSRRHRIHSSGDYKHPPPTGEHAGLYRYHLERSGEPVDIEVTLRERMGDAFVRALVEAGHPVVVFSLAGEHAHALVDLPDNMPLIRAIIGDAKRIASRSVKAELPGQVWSRGGEFRRIKDDAHWANAYDYIRDGQEPGAWVWYSEEGERLRSLLEGRYPRRRYGRKTPSALPRRG